MNGRFSYFNSESLTETLDFLDKMAKQSRRVHPIAGGTGILVDIRQGIVEPEYLVDVGFIPELKQIEIANGTVNLGAAVTLNEVTQSPVLKEHCSFLVEAAQSIGSPQIRNRATVGGNIVSASPAADMVPPLIALGAEVILQRKGSARAILLEHFMKGLKLTDRKNDEILTLIKFQGVAEGQRGIFYKLGKRRSLAVSVINLAIVATLFKGDSNLEDIRIVVGAVAPTAIRMREAEKILLTGPISKERIAEAAEAASATSKPISDIRGSEGYRQSMVKFVLMEQLSKLLISSKN